MDGRRSLFRPNLAPGERGLRAVASLLFATGAFLFIDRHAVIAALLLASAAFLMFEALRGWCALRACGVRTKF